MSTSKCLLCGKGEKEVTSLEMHLKEWHRVSTSDESLMASILKLVSSSNRDKKQSLKDQRTKGPFREITNQLNDKMFPDPKMSGTKSVGNSGNPHFVEKENQQIVQGTPASIPPMPKTRSGSGSPLSGTPSKPTRSPGNPSPRTPFKLTQTPSNPTQRRSFKNVVPESPVMLIKSQGHQKEEMSWMEYLTSPDTIMALETPRDELEEEDNVLGEEDKEEINSDKKSDSSPSDHEPKDAKMLDETEKETNGQYGDQEKAKALIAHRRYF